MKIATYNIWDNNEAGMPFRFQQIEQVIAKLGADILCLQEVSDCRRYDGLADLCGYDHSHYQAQAGLAILSRFPICQTVDFEYGTATCMQISDKNLMVVNVHLPWESASLREKVIVNIVENTKKLNADFMFIMGDFNSSANSSVHRFLTNEQSLFGSDAYFYDLAEAFAEITGTKPLPTLNFRENPRWGVIQPKNTIEINQRFDWIMLKNPYPMEFPDLKHCGIFGTEVSEETGLAASDHYGVYAEIEFRRSL